jgi:hypothetical protein
MLHRHWLLLTLQVLQCWPMSRRVKQLACTG